jgi:drug/metabolite transporter (DMT)-like permease
MNLLVWLISGGNFVAFKLGVASMPPFAMIGARLLISGSALVALSPLLDRDIFRRQDVIAKSQMLALTCGAILTFVLGQGVIVWGITHTSAGAAAVLSASSPLFLGLFSWALLHKPPQPLQWLGIAVGFAGCALLISGKGSDQGIDPAAAAAVLIGAAGFAGGLLIQRNERLPKRKFLNTGIQMLIAAVILLLLSYLAGEYGRIHPSQIALRSWLAFAYITLPGSLIAFALIVWLARTASALIANSFAYAAPAIAILLSAPLLAEPITPTLLGAAALALAGAALMGERRPRPRA